MSKHIILIESARSTFTLCNICLEYIELENKVINSLDEYTFYKPKEIAYFLGEFQIKIN